MANAKTMLERLEDAAPYNIFYNKVLDLPQTFEQNSIEFSDLLCPSLGKLKSSLQIIPKVNLDWLVNQYAKNNVGTLPLSVLYGEHKASKEKCLKEDLTNITQYKPRNKHFNIKMGIYLYEDDSLRIAIYTANLHSMPWEHFSLGIWVSPLCRHLPAEALDTDGESPTGFKSKLIKYLPTLLEPQGLKFWIDRIKRADFSDVRVFLVTSVPGQRISLRDHKSLIQQVEHLLKQHCQLPEKEHPWPIIAQSSTLGKYGGSPEEWLWGLFLKGLSQHTQSEEVHVSSIPLKIIHPTYKQVKDGSFSDDILAEAGIYATDVHSKQNWFQEYLHEWKADKLGRSKALSLTKTYCRVSPTYDKMAWFLLTTANITKGSWIVECSEGRIRTRNYEVGVMFFPKFFGEEYFNVVAETGQKVFPLIYDLPPKKYGEMDRPWTSYYERQ